MWPCRQITCLAWLLLPRQQHQQHRQQPQAETERWRWGHTDATAATFHWHAGAAAIAAVAAAQSSTLFLVAFVLFVVVASNCQLCCYHCVSGCFIGRCVAKISLLKRFPLCKVSVCVCVSWLLFLLVRVAAGSVVRRLCYCCCCCCWWTVVVGFPKWRRIFATIQLLTTLVVVACSFFALLQAVGIFFVTYRFVVVCLFSFQVFGPVMRVVGSVANDDNKIQICPAQK